MPIPSETWAIEAHGLTKTFGSLTAVRSVTLQVPGGTIFAFLGPNGSGKSTTVKLLTGLLPPTAGEARVNGRVVSVDDVELRREIGILPEDDALFPDLTIWEHLELCGRLYGLERHEADARAIQLLRHLDLEHGRTTIVEKASFGMRKKCALAMALLHNPHVLFLDEPFEGIDPGSSRNIKDLLVTLAQRGTAVFLTSHILEIVERLAERFALIVKGEVVCCQTVSDLARAGTTLEELYLRYAGKPDTGNLEWLGHR
ncbi:MAG TPA: ABC transporter ATP-binding protein [Vicinamibacterales bacterium]|jgi:ABC-2 type transport system ATP-binding protein